MFENVNDEAERLMARDPRTLYRQGVTVNSNRSCRSQIASYPDMNDTDSYVEIYAEVSYLSEDYLDQYSDRLRILKFVIFLPRFILFIFDVQLRKSKVYLLGR